MTAPIQRMPMHEEAEWCSADSEARQWARARGITPAGQLWERVLESGITA